MNCQRIFISLAACFAFALPNLSFGVTGAKLEVTDAGGHAVTASAAKTVVGWGSNNYEPLTISPSIGDVESFAAGYYSSMTINAQGNLRVWGKSYDGQANIPSDLPPCIAAAGGSGFTMVLKADRTVAAWGQNSNGQTDVPPSLKDVVAIAAGGWHAAALRADGRVVSWGQRILHAPVITDAVAVTAGGLHTAVIRRSGKVVCWTNDYQGLLKRVPAGLGHVVSIDAGWEHVLAATAEGNVVGWGYNHRGALDVPPALGDVESVAAGHWHSAALKYDGTVVLWGNAGLDPATSTVPSGLSGVLALDAGNGYTLALVEPANDFGKRNLGTSRSHTFFLNNVAGTTLSVAQIEIEGNDASQFGVTSGALPLSVTSTTKSPFSVKFTPTKLGLSSVNLKIYTNDPTSPFVLPVHGEGGFQVTATSTSDPKGTFTYAPLRLERQTGLLLQTINFINTSGFSLQGLKLLLSNVASGVQLYSSSTGKTPGTLEVIYSNAIKTNETITFDLVYFDPRRRTAEAMNPVVKADAMLEPEPDSLPVTGTVVPLLRARSTPQGPFLEWNSVPGKTYVVEYSNDGGTTWFSAVHRLSTGGTRMFWTDRGQPETKTKPADEPNKVGGRYYRVKRL